MVFDKNMAGKSRFHRFRHIILPAVFIVTLAIALLCADLFFSLALGDDFAPLIYKPDKRLGYVHIPDMEALQIGLFNPRSYPDMVIKNPFNVRINSLGMRGADYNGEKGGIASLGDSCSFGWGEDESDIFVNIAAKGMAGKIKGRAYNMGVAGYSSLQGLLWLQTAIHKIKPDFVTINFGSNDGRDTRIHSPLWLFPSRPDRENFGPDAELSSGVKLKIGLMSLLTPLLKYSAIINWLSKGVRGRKIIKRSSRQSGVVRVSVDEYRKNLNSIMDVVEKAGGYPILLSICSTGPYIEMTRRVAEKRKTPLIVDKDLYRAGFDELRADEEYGELVRAVEKRYGADLIDKIPELQYTNDGCHPNRLGHRLIGDELLQVMTSLDGRPSQKERRP